MIVNLSLMQVNDICLLLRHLLESDSSLPDSIRTTIKDILTDLDSARVRFIQSIGD